MYTHIYVSFARLLTELREITCTGPASANLHRGCSYGRESNCNNARILKPYDIFLTKERLYNFCAVRRDLHHLRASLFVDISDTDICFVLNEEFR